MEQQPQRSQMVNESPTLLIPNISTEQIQKCLEENTQLIQFILESKRLGRHKECEMQTAKLQHNLTLLSNLADVMAPPPPPPPKPIPPQAMAVGPTRQQGQWSTLPRPQQPVQLNGEENRIQQQQQGYYLQQQFMGFSGANNNYNNSNNNNNTSNNSQAIDHQDGGGASHSTAASNFLGI